MTENVTNEVINKWAEQTTDIIFNEDAKENIKIKEIVNILLQDIEKIKEIQNEQIKLQTHKEVIQSLEEGVVENFKYYKKFQEKVEQLYEKCFKELNELGQIIRGQGDQPINLRLYAEKDGELQDVITAREKDLTLQSPKRRKYKKFFNRQLVYTLENLQEKRLEIKDLTISDSFKKYYNNFKIVGLEDRKNPNNNKKPSYNLGHIQEAFDRHWKIYNPERTQFYQGNFEPVDLVTNDVEREKVHILIYYALNSNSWLTGGDNILDQIKGDNRKLSNFKTIENALNKILNIINLSQNEKGETKAELEKIFQTKYKDEIDKDLNGSLKNMTGEELKNLIDNKLGDSYKNKFTIKI